MSRRKIKKGFRTSLFLKKAALARAALVALYIVLSGQTLQIGRLKFIAAITLIICGKEISGFYFTK